MLSEAPVPQNRLRPRAGVAKSRPVAFTSFAVAAASALFLGMLACFEVGRQLGRLRMSRDADGLTVGSGPVEAAIFGLLGLLLAFTFSGAASRFEARRALITQETNAIGTAYRRLDVLPPDLQPALRDAFRRYVDVRATVYRDKSNDALTARRISESSALQDQIWDAAKAGLQRTETPVQAEVFLLTALNEMFDITTVRTGATMDHPPAVVFYLLACLSLTSALLTGYAMSKTLLRSWFYMLLLAVTLSVTFYVILDLEYPRAGVIRVDESDRMLLNLRQSLR